MRRVRTPDAPFVGGTAFDGSRPLRIVLDDALGAGEAEDLLRGFARHEHVEIFAKGDQHDGIPVIVQDDLDEHQNLHYEVRRPTRLTRGGVHYAGQYRRIAVQMVEEWGATNTDDTYRELVLAQIARSLGADALATRSEFILDQAPAGLVERANPMTPDEALALMGLYLRLRGDFTVYMSDGFTEETSRGGWYWVLTRDMLRAGWDWFGACVRTSSASGDDTAMLLGQSTLERFDRALRARDHVLHQFHLPPTRDTSDEALFYLDVVLLMLNGAFDAAARVTHIVYALTGGVSWRWEDWRDKLCAADAAFVPLLAGQSQARDAIDLVALLRNTVHGEALRGIEYEEHGTPRTRENLVLLPAKDPARLLGAVARRGGDERWGVRPLWGDEVGIEADTFLEALIPTVATALNDLMGATDVGRLPGVSASDLTGPPTDSTSEFSPAQSRLHRLLAGLA